MKRILMLLLAMIMAVSMAFCFTACGEDEDTGDGSGDTGSGDTGAGDSGSGDTGTGDSDSGDTGIGDRDEDSEIGEIRAIYNSYVVAVTARGETPLSYEEWLATVKGEKGDPGAPGKDGTVWHVGEGMPSSVDGAKLGDFYINKTSFEVYHLTASGWSLLGSIKGEDGEDASGSGSQGAPGKDGTVWYTGSGAPSGISAKEGDLYLDTASSDIYKYSSGNWSKIANIKGDKGEDGEDGNPDTPDTSEQPGTVWFFGDGAPTLIDGAKSGDCYLDTDSFTIYRLEGDNWVKMATSGSGNTGSSPSDIEVRRQELRGNAIDRFDELYSKYNITDERIEEFNNLIDKLSEADTFEALDKIDCDINDLLLRIENEASGGSESPAKEYRLTIKQDTMTLGTDIEAFLEEYFVGTSIVAAYSDGTEDVVYTFDNPGYANISGEYDSVGDVFCIEVSIGLGYDTVNLRHYVRVVADLSGAEATVYYFDSASVFGDMLTLYRIADGSLVCEADGSQSAAELQGNVLTVFAPITTYVLELYTSATRNTVKYYQPTEAPFVTLTQNEGDITYSVSFYGDYDVAGEYIMILSNIPEESMNGLSIYSYINLEARLFNFPLGGGDTYLQFLEDFTIAPMSFTDSDECFFDIALMNPTADDIAIDQRLYHDFANSLTLEELLEIWCPIAGYPTDSARVIINNELVSDYTIEISPRDRVWIAPSDAIIITGIFNYSDSTETIQTFLPAGATLEVFVGMYGCATRDIYINDEPIDYEANRELVLKEGDKISATIGGEDVTPEAPENPGGTENGGAGGGDVNGFDPEKVTDTREYETDPSLMGVESITVYALNDGSYYMYDGHGTYLPVSLWHDRTVSLSMGGVTMLITLDDTNDTAYWYGGSSEVVMTVTSADGTKTAIIYNDTHATDGMYVARLTNGEGNTWTALISYDSGALTITAIPLGWYNEIITLTDKDKGTVGNSGGSGGGDIEETQASYTLYHILDYSTPAYKQTVYMDGFGGVSLTGCVPEFSESAVVLINGWIIPKEEYGTTFICDSDVVIIAPDGYFVITVGSPDKGSQQVLACEHCTVSWVAETYGYDAYDTIYRNESIIEDANTEYVYEGDLLDFLNGSAGSVLESDRYSTHVYASLDEAGEIMYLMLKPGLVVTLEDYMKDNGFSLDTHDIFLNGVRVSAGSDMLGQVIGVYRQDIESYDHIIVAPKGATIFELNRDGRAPMHAVVRDGTSVIDAAEIYKLDTSAPIYLNGEVITDLYMVITDGDTLSANITEDVYETAAEAVTE